MTNRTPDEHLGAETLQALLEGELSTGERAQAEEHLASCARCSAELDGWRLLFGELGELLTLSPTAGFRERVMAEVQPRPPLSVGARVAALVGFHPSGRHPSSERLQDFVDGVLPQRQAARVRAHLDVCPGCDEDAAGWRALATYLDDVPRLAPADGFAERVMAGVRVAMPVPVKAPEWRRVLAAAWSVVPKTRRAWAALCGVAVTPMTILGLLLWTIFTSPGITAGGLASFAWWKASALLGAAWGALSKAVLESQGLFDAYSFLGSLVHSPAAVAVVFLLFSAGTVSAACVLYRNLVPTRQVEGRYADAPLS